MDANLQDLIQELWLRRRNSGEIKWTTKSGEAIPIKEMSNQHLLNTINMLIQNQQYSEIAEEYYTYINQHF